MPKVKYCVINEQEKAAEYSKKNPPHSPYQIEEILILESSFSDGFDKMIK